MNHDIMIDGIDDTSEQHPHYARRTIYDAAYQYCCSGDGGRVWNETVLPVVVVEGVTTDDLAGAENDVNNGTLVDMMMIDIIEDWNEDLPLFQQQQHVRQERPCLIRDGPRLQHCFVYPRTHWVTHHHEPRIHRDWFRDTCPDTMVPVYWNHRKATSSTMNASYDDDDDNTNPTDDGRVTECPKQHMTIPEYLTHPCWDDQEDDDDDECVDNTTQHNPGVPYLKDWHFQFWYEQQQSSSSSSPQHRPTEFHYTLPDYLPYDLLNGFLLRFDPLATSLSSSISSPFKNHDNTNEGGPHHGHQHRNELSGESQQSLYNDYRFVYWGPRHSSTDIHTDVLLSLSWSYNVCGTKLWTFYIPTTNPQHTDHTNETVVSIEQKTGELIIVPSGMRHSVTNQQETLSINHNWITTDILPCVWQCIRSEMIAVDEDLSAWGTTYRVTCYHARESMLRACVGLNVSLYFFMVLTRGIDLCQDTAVAPTPLKENRRRYNDLLHIRDALQQILDDPMVHLSDRLAATLQSDLSSARAIRTGMDCVQAITRVVGT